MARHFLALYLLIVLTLAAISWAQQQLLSLYGQQSAAEMAAANPVQVGLLKLLEQRAVEAPPEQRADAVHAMGSDVGLNVELLDAWDIAGDATLARLAAGELAFMSAQGGETWLLRQLPSDGRVLALKYTIPEPKRSALDWALTLMFFAAIALALMIWIWPLTRDLRILERATLKFGDRNWRFDAALSPRSQVFPLAQAFRRMAERIDGLIQSHKDLSNAAAHEIKTPLARMRFELEIARATRDPQELAARLDNIGADVTELNAFVTAMLDYAVLERAEVALNVGAHDFTVLIPAVTESVRRSAPNSLHIVSQVRGDAAAVMCDAHLMETVLRNLIYNALRYARTQVHVRFEASPDGAYRLFVDDDGPGIPAADRERIFGSFVQLGERSEHKGGFGLGLAIVKRIAEWHGGAASAQFSPLGGARFSVAWDRVHLAPTA